MAHVRLMQGQRPSADDILKQPAAQPETDQTRSFINAMFVAACSTTPTDTWYYYSPPCAQKAFQTTSCVETLATYHGVATDLTRPEIQTVVKQMLEEALSHLPWEVRMISRRPVLQMQRRAE